MEITSFEAYVDLLLHISPYQDFLLKGPDANQRDMIFCFCWRSFSPLVRFKSLQTVWHIFCEHGLEDDAVNNLGDVI